MKTVAPPHWALELPLPCLFITINNSKCAVCNLNASLRKCSRQLYCPFGWLCLLRNLTIDKNGTEKVSKQLQETVAAPQCLEFECHWELWKEDEEENICKGKLQFGDLSLFQVLFPMPYVYICFANYKMLLLVLLVVRGFTWQW